MKIKNNIISPLLNSKIKEPYNSPRQKLPKIYWQTGNFEFLELITKKKLKVFLEKKYMVLKLTIIFQSILMNGKISSLPSR